MIRPFWGRALVLLLVILAAGALAAGAYSMGVSAGMATAGTGAVATAPHASGYGVAAGWAFPWFFFWPIFPILIIVFFALVLRVAFWGRGPRHPGGWHDERWSEGPGARFDDWHRRAHEAQEPPPGSGS